MINAFRCIFVFFEAVGRIAISFAPLVIFVSAMMWLQPWEWFA